MAKKVAWWLVGGLFVLSFLAAGGMMYLLRTADGNRRLCAFGTRPFDENLQGRLEIDQIEELELQRLVARGVRFIPPQGGPPAIEVPRVTITFDPLDFLHGSFGWQHAEVERPLVRVTELPNGKTNMEELFASRPGEPSEGGEGQRHVALKGMVTHRAKLWIGGGSLPKLYLSELDGVMRIDIDPEGKAVLRFDEYEGKLDGLPTGALSFHDVKGQVFTEGKRLLHFEGAGRSEDEPVEFDLDIVGTPADVHIGARFKEPSTEALKTRLIAAWTKFSSNIDFEVSR